MGIIDIDTMIFGQNSFYIVTWIKLTYNLFCILNIGSTKDDKSVVASHLCQKILYTETFDDISSLGLARLVTLSY
jgi:hypothetical protein